MTAAVYDLHAVTVDPTTGALTDHGSWANVELGDVQEVLNGTGSFSFTAAALDSYVASVNPKPYATEVRLDRAGTPIFAGPIVTVESDGTTISFQAEDLSGYFAERYVDLAAGRTDYLAGDGDFEAGVGAWTAHGTVTLTSDTAQHHLGTKSAKVVSSGANLDNYISRTFNITGTGVGSLVTVPFWFRLQDSGFLGAALASFGLYVVQKDPITHAIINPDPDDLVQIDGAVERDVWNRVKAITRVPVLANVDVEVRLYSWGGTGWWDAGRAVLMESTAFDNSDQTAIAWALVNFCQTPGNGWSNLGLTNGTTASGLVRSRAYQHADHQRLDACLQEYAEMDDGFDWAVLPNRAFTTFYPRRGTDRSGTTTLTVDGNCLLKRWSVDGHQAASSVVVLGTGSGPDREEGNANTGSGTIVGGTTVRKFITPRQSDPPIDTLTSTAVRELAISDNPTIWEVEITDRTVAALVGVGDKVTLSVPSGVVGSYLAASGVFRIVSKTWHPGPDTALVTLNAAI